jgi:hypothetical protein
MKYCSGRTATIALAVAFLLASCDASDCSDRIQSQIASDPPSTDISEHFVSMRLTGSRHWQLQIL